MSANVLAKPKTQATKKQSENNIKNVEDWRKYIIKNWQSLKKQADSMKIVSPYEQLLVMAFLPVLPKNKTTLKKALKLIRALRYCEPLAQHFEEIYARGDFNITVAALVQKHLSPSTEQQIGLDWLLVSLGTLFGLRQKTEKTTTFVQDLKTGLKRTHNAPSAVRVQAGMISAGQNLVFAGQDVNIVSENYKGSRAKLRNYLSALRTEWNMPATNIHPRAQGNTTVSLHQVYTPVDRWVDSNEFTSASVEQLMERRFRAIDQDLHEARQSILEAIATHPLMVVTGGAGSGKSSLCHYIVTALAYACDPSAEEKDEIKGLELLGPAWIHGALLPLLVGLRDFCNDETIFPKYYKDAKADCLLNYLKKTTGSFAPHLEEYLTQTDVQTQGTLLVLDGLDEVYNEKHRIILQRIIEQWVNRFPNTRVLITSRTYAYRQDAAWRLSERFVSAELAPFTWSQIKKYIEGWYVKAAELRPAYFGGSLTAKERADEMAENLIDTLLNSKSLWPLARHPLMLTLLTLIHEDYKYLPSKRAELYEQTVELLDRWNIPSPSDELHEKLSKINLERMRAALKSIAFDLQSEQKSFQRYPTIIKRGQLLDKLIEQNQYGDGLGANIEDVLEYLATRNGIIVSDTNSSYRFPHLSIQEYLAACALIEFYDECPMPKVLKPSCDDGWQFPENIAALLRHDHYRWRQVALFAGSIIAAGKGQVLRWQLIDELLPNKLTDEISEGILYSICVAAEIWNESWIKARTRMQTSARDHLITCLEAVRNDERLDAPERANNILILLRLYKSLGKDDDAKGRKTN